MEGDLFYQRIKGIALELLNLCADYESDEYAKEQLLKSIPLEERIVQFPCRKPIEKNNTAKKNEKQYKKSILEFTQKEISKMPQEFRKQFKTGHHKAHIQKRNESYEIRLMIKGRRISASNKNLEVAKKMFIEKLYQLKESRADQERKNISFKDYMYLWLETSKKPYIKDTTYKSYLQVFNVNILPSFEKKKLTEITSFDLQNFINEYVKAEKYRTAQKAFQLLKSVFEFAVADSLLERSPMAKIKIATYEKETGTGLTRAEEQTLLKTFYSDTDNLYLQAFIFFLYTGIRRSELASAEMDDLWITVICAKTRKGRKEKNRRIPISPMLRRIIKKINFDKIKKLNLTVLSHEFKKILPKHHLHELRHTFITRCQECGIPREFVSVWAGHAADQTITTTVYTHLEQFDDKQLEEISKFIYDL